MDLYLLANHLLNFAAPAAGVALLLVLLTRAGFGFFRSNRPLVQTVSAQAAIVFVANLVILAVGLLAFGRDGKMLTYVALVVGAAVCQWVLMRGWSRA